MVTSSLIHYLPTTLSELKAWFVALFLLCFVFVSGTIAIFPWNIARGLQFLSASLGLASALLFHRGNHSVLVLLTMFTAGLGYLAAIMLP